MSRLKGLIEPDAPVVIVEGAVEPDADTMDAAVLGMNGLVLAALEDVVAVTETGGNKDKRS